MEDGPDVDGFFLFVATAAAATDWTCCDALLLSVARAVDVAAAASLFLAKPFFSRIAWRWGAAFAIAVSSSGCGFDSFPSLASASAPTAGATTLSTCSSRSSRSLIRS